MKVLVMRPPAAEAGGTFPLTIAGWLLRFAVLGFSIGIAATIFGKLGSGLNGYFFLEHGIPHGDIAPVERWVAVALVAVACAAFLRPHWGFLLPIAALIFLEAWARVFNGGAPFSEWTIYAYGLRIAAPLALAMLFSTELHRWLGARLALQGTGWVLRIAIAIVFTIHGIEAFLGHPRFIDYIIGTSWNLFGYDIAESTTRIIMQVIGVVDILVAAAVIIRPVRPVLYWMAFWGFITALSRVTTFGFSHHYEVLVRFSHFLAPLALLLILSALREMRSEPEASPVPAGHAADQN